jgi:hypothetical protein
VMCRSIVAMLHWSVVLSLSCCLLASASSSPHTLSDEMTSPIASNSPKSYLRNHELEDRTMAVSALHYLFPEHASPH